jgi:hypothetical protein
MIPAEDKACIAWHVVSEGTDIAAVKWAVGEDELLLHSRQLAEGAPWSR